MCQLTKLVIATWLPCCLPVFPAVLSVLSAVLPNLPVVLVAPLLLNTSTGNTWIQESMQFAATDDVWLRGTSGKHTFAIDGP